MNYATAVNDRPQSEIEQISSTINGLLERSSGLSEQLSSIMDRLAGPTPLGDEPKSLPRAVRNGALGHMAEQLEYLDGHVSRISGHLSRLDKIV